MDDSLLSRAFDVEEIPDDFDPSIPPSTGHEYLQQVMYEASKCPQVMVAEIDDCKIKNILNSDIELCKTENISCSTPSEDWQEHQIALFSELRKKVELSKKSSKFKPFSLPKIDNEEKWFSLCFGEKNSRMEPSLSLLLSMNELLKERLLEYQVEWLKEKGLKWNQGKWLYALLACLNVPLTCITCSVLRDLARECAKIRCSERSLKESDIAMLSLIICLIKKYFGQTDLSD